MNRLCLFLNVIVTLGLLLVVGSPFCFILSLALGFLVLLLLALVQ